MREEKEDKCDDNIKIKMDKRNSKEKRAVTREREEEENKKWEIKKGKVHKRRENKK